MMNSNKLKNPITVIIGDRERDNRLISFRKYDSNETISMEIEEFVQYLKKEIKKR